MKQKDLKISKFKFWQHKMLPKSYKNLFDGYSERVAKYQETKKSVPKPQGKPKINSNSKLLLKWNLIFKENI